MVDAEAETTFAPAIWWRLLHKSAYFNRIEISTRSDVLAYGIAAPVHDAAWILSRQHVLGEVLGENGGAPIAVRYTGDVIAVSELVAGSGPPRSIRATDAPWET